MFTQAEEIKMQRETAENGVIDFISAEYEGDALAEILEIAIARAIDEFDAEQESDGQWTDCTNYAECARRAEEQWNADAQAAHETAQDDKAHAARDVARGL